MLALAVIAQFVFSVKLAAAADASDRVVQERVSDQLAGHTLRSARTRSS